jgi:hypothetical protein
LIFQDEELSIYISPYYRGIEAVTLFSGYDQIPWGEKFILWRHDLDFSINRATVLAKIESEEGIRATYFINPRSSFYNPFEPSQAELIKKIIKYEHWIGLHFDAQANEIQT